MPATWLYFVEDQLLTAAFWVFGIGVGIRLLVFFATMVKSQVADRQGTFLSGLMKILLLMTRALFPMHRNLLRRPVYTGLRYVFHLCLLVVPIWYSGHVYMIEESSLGWFWEPLADEHIETMTMSVIWLGVFFILRRLAVPEVRRQSSLKDHGIILVTVMPYLTGYWYVAGTLDHIAFFEKYLWYLHIVSGELMIVMAVFLFVRTRLDASRCVGCASCTVSCPTGTLISRDTRGHRDFFYSHYQCICCAACAATCPERAATLRHDVSLSRFFSVFGRRKIQERELCVCGGCSQAFAPDRQLEVIRKRILDQGAEVPSTLSYCGRCKKRLSVHPAG